MLYQAYVRKVVTDENGLPLGQIVTVFERKGDGPEQYRGSYFEQYKRVPRGACVQYGINHGYSATLGRTA